MELTTRIEQWPVARPFRIAYHTFHARDLLVVEARDGAHVGRGEAGGHPHLEPLADAQKRIDALATTLTREDLLTVLPAGPARNALDCALWDLEAKRTQRRAWTLAGLPAPQPIRTAYTIGIAEIDAMVAQARAMGDFSLLKIKVDGAAGFAALRAIAAARPDAEFIVDANEGWRRDELDRFLADAAALRVRLIEQPLPRGADDVLLDFDSPIPFAADESFHTIGDLARIADRYRVVNIKLDKIGGLTAALRAAAEAERRGLTPMVGCNGATSLGIAPAYCLALRCRWVDLDSPLLLARDRAPGMTYRDGCVLPPRADVWG